jgi:hypothetical protein
MKRRTISIGTIGGFKWGRANFVELKLLPSLALDGSVPEKAARSIIEGDRFDELVLIKLERRAERGSPREG